MATGAMLDHEEYEAADRAAVEARGFVAGQLTSLIETVTITGSDEMLAGRIRAVVAAKKGGDKLIERAAYMELAVAAASCAVGLDLNGVR